MSIRNVFGANDNRPGMKPVTNVEWNELNDSLRNMDVSNVYDQTNFDSNGIGLSGQAFFFPHVAGIDNNYTDAIIGPDREEDFYPYEDALSIPTYSEVWTLIRPGIWGGPFAYFGERDSQTRQVSVRFPTASVIGVEKPADNDDGEIVGYRWELVPKVTNITGLVKNARLSVTIEWVPEAVFDPVGDSQASLFNADPGEDPDQWAPTYGDNEENTTKLKVLIDQWLLVNEPSYYPFSIIDESNLDIPTKLISVPVARYDWNPEQTRLDRCVQLLFGSFIGGGGGNTTGSDLTLGIKHPFKAQIYEENSDLVEVGFLRPDWKDFMTIYDARAGGNAGAESIDFAAPETIQITEDSYVYYRVQDRNGTWTATLETHANYIPPDETNPDRWFLIGYATWAAAEGELPDRIAEWRQHAFECPEFHMYKPQNHAFEGFPVKDAAGAIAQRLFSSGRFLYGNQVVETTDGQILAETASNDVWFVVKVDFSADAFPLFTQPTISLIDEAGLASTNLIKGTMSAEIEWKSTEVMWMRVKVGSWDADLNWKQLVQNDVVYKPDMVFNAEETDEFHSEDNQIPRGIGGSGRAYQASTCYADDDGKFKVKEKLEGPVRHDVRLHHSGTAAYIETTQGDIVMQNPDHDDDLEVMVIGGNPNKVAKHSLRIDGQDRFVRSRLGNDGDGHVNTVNPLGAAGDYQIQSDSKGKVKFFENVAAIADSQQVHMSFHPESSKITAVIKGAADNVLQLEGKTPGADFIRLFLNKMNAKIKSNVANDTELALEVLDSGEQELFSVRADGRTRVGDNWNVPTDAPTAANQVIASVAGDLENPVWSGGGGTVTVVTDMRLDSSNNLQIKTTEIQVLSNEAESAWTTVTDWATTACP